MESKAPRKINGSGDSVSPKPTKKINPVKPLIILDINGVLAEKTFIGKGSTPKGAYKVNGVFYMIKPEVSTFIAKLFQKYRVAIFSSTTRRNAMPLIKKVFTQKQVKRLLFIWTRDRTRKDPENLNGFKTIKKLDDFWDNPVFNAKGCYDKSNTIILDDESEKQRFNPEECLIIFNIKNPESDFETLLNTIETRLMANSMKNL